MHYVDIKLKLFDDDDDISEETEEDIANVKKFRVIPRSNSDEQEVGASVVEALRNQNSEDVTLINSIEQFCDPNMDSLREVMTWEVISLARACRNMVMFSQPSF